MTTQNRKRGLFSVAPILGMLFATAASAEQLQLATATHQVSYHPDVILGVCDTSSAAKDNPNQLLVAIRLEFPPAMFADRALDQQQFSAWRMQVAIDARTIVEQAMARIPKSELTGMTMINVLEADFAIYKNAFKSGSGHELTLGLTRGPFMQNKCGLPSEYSLDDYIRDAAEAFKAIEPPSSTTQPEFMPQFNTGATRVQHVQYRL